MRASGVFFIFLLSFGLALASGNGLLTRLAYVLGLALGLGFLWSWLSLRWLKVEIEWRTLRAQVGGKAEESITIANQGKLPKLWLGLKLLSDLPNYKGGRVISLPGREARLWKVSVSCEQRGKFTMGPVEVECRDPLGIFHLRRILGGFQYLLVHPAIHPLPSFSLPVAQLSGEGTTYRRTQQLTPSAYGVRDYAYGDSLKRIHWLTTARVGRLMVKNFEEEPSGNIWIFLDLKRGCQAGEGTESTVEYGVSIAASVAAKFLGEGRAVGLMAYGDRPYYLSAEKGPQQLWRILEILAVVKGEGSTPLDQALLKEGRHLGRHDVLVVITPSPEPDWLASLGFLTHKGVRAVVTLLEGKSFGGEGNTHFLPRLAAGGIPVCLVRQGQALEEALKIFYSGAV